MQGVLDVPACARLPNGRMIDVLTEQVKQHRARRRDQTRIRQHDVMGYGDVHFHRGEIRPEEHGFTDLFGH